LDILRPHWKAMTVAFLAVAVESAADILQPWPLKIVLDNVLQSKPLPHAVTTLFPSLDPQQSSLLFYAVVSVAVIAIAGAAGSFLESWITATVGQRIMHELRSTVYHHIQRLSLADHDEKRTGDLIGRVTS